MESAPDEVSKRTISNGGKPQPTFDGAGGGNLPVNEDSPQGILQPTSTSPCPMETLPAELLIAVLACSAPLSARRLQQLSSVCITWWRVIKGAQILWTEIDFQDNSTEIELKIRKSGVMKLQANVAPPMDSVRMNLELMAQTAHRLQSLNLQLKSAHHLQALLDVPMPNLERIMLVVAAGNVEQLPILRFNSVEVLREVKTLGVALTLGDGKEGVKSLLIGLSRRMSGGAGGLSYSFFDQFHSLQSLQELHISGVSPGPAEEFAGQVRWQDVELHLPHLKRLSLLDLHVCMATMILQSLRVTSLTRFHIQLNKKCLSTLPHNYVNPLLTSVLDRTSTGHTTLFVIENLEETTALVIQDLPRSFQLRVEGLQESSGDVFHCIFRQMPFSSQPINLVLSFSSQLVLDFFGAPFYINLNDAFLSLRSATSLDLYTKGIDDAVLVAKALTNWMSVQITEPKSMFMTRFLPFLKTMYVVIDSNDRDIATRLDYHRAIASMLSTRRRGLSSMTGSSGQAVASLPAAAELTVETKFPNDETAPPSKVVFALPWETRNSRR